MPPESRISKIVKGAFEKVRPGSGNGPAKAISIIDTKQGRAGDRSPLHRNVGTDQPDPAKTSWPVVATNFTSDDKSPLIPTGLLEGVSEETGAIPRYEADDSVVLYRLFGVRSPAEE